MKIENWELKFGWMDFFYIPPAVWRTPLKRGWLARCMGIVGGMGDMGRMGDVGRIDLIEWIDLIERIDAIGIGRMGIGDGRGVLGRRG